MCYCNPQIRSIQCGSIYCIPPESPIENDLERVMRLSKKRAGEVLKDKGGELTFDELLASIYFQGWQDSKLTH